MKFEKKFEVVSKKNLIVNLYAMKTFKKYLKTKIKSYKGKINTDFYNIKKPK